MERRGSICSNVLKLVVDKSLNNNSNYSSNEAYPLELTNKVTQNLSKTQKNMFLTGG